MGWTLYEHEVVARGGSARLAFTSLTGGTPCGPAVDAISLRAAAGDDRDEDGVPDDEDNCPEEANPDQADSDDDGNGDACDGCPEDPEDDADEDGACGDVDNCPDVDNEDQLDFDEDGAGDACDADDDDDGVDDDDDGCPETPEDEVAGDDGCSIEQLCPCEAEWRNHGAYVSCVAHAAKTLRRAGLISGAEKGAIQSSAAKSDCGR